MINDIVMELMAGVSCQLSKGLGIAVHYSLSVAYEDEFFTELRRDVLTLDGYIPSIHLFWIFKH